MHAIRLKMWGWRGDGLGPPLTFTAETQLLRSSKRSNIHPDLPTLGRGQATPSDFERSYAATVNVFLTCFMPSYIRII